MPKQIDDLDYEEYKRKLLENSERDDLSELQQKYANIDEPDYDNMNLHDELQTRLELQKMNELQNKYGATQTPVPQSQIATSSLQSNTIPNYSKANTQSLRLNQPTI